VVQHAGALHMSTCYTNLATLGERWKQQAFAEGRAKGKAAGKVEGKVEGRVEGRAEGRAAGKAEALVCLLVERFGALAPPLRTRIRRAKLAALERWFKRAIVAPDLPSVFD
jgi:hypothetical protein